MEQIAKDFMDQLYAAVRVIGLQAERIWPQLVGITFVKSVSWIVIGIAMIIAAFYYSNKGRKFFFEWEKGLNRDDRGLGIFLGVVCMVAGLIVVVIAVSTILNSVPGVFYPEAQTVLNLIKEVKK